MTPLKDGKVALLFSGGIDSMLLADRAHREGRLGVLVFISYNQPSIAEERKAVEGWASERGYEVDTVSAHIMGVHEHMGIGAAVEGLRILPGRNMIMIAHAANIALAKGCSVVWYGANADDKDYADCTQNFVCAMNDIVGASLLAVEIEAPLIDMTKKEIIKEAREVGMDLDKAWSCYEASTFDKACGACHSCKERIEAVV